MSEPVVGAGRHRRPVAVVTGAGRGIGARVAADLHAAGLVVVLADRDGAAAAASADALGEDGHPWLLDVTDGASVRAAVATIEEHLGPITVWVNNAGIMPTEPFVGQDAVVADRVLATNLGGMLACTRAVLPRMVARGRGVVVNVGSATATKPLAGLAVYSASKGAVLAFTRALRRELRGSGVHVGVVLPYLADTAMGAGITAQRGFRAVTPAEVSAQVMRVVRRRDVVRYVPPALRWGVALMDALPQAWQDRVDDVIGTDRIGLGGEARARASYRADALGPDGPLTPPSPPPPAR